ncbi:MAG: GrlR family regulatory protein [Nanoarchaeota archaeon]
MLEALWSVEFVSNLQVQGAGVVVLETGRVFGGDAQYFYVGDYNMHHDKAQVSLKVKHYSGAPNSIFGQLKEFHVKLEGTPNREKFDMIGHLVEDPTRKMAIRLTRRAELP